MEVMTLQHRHAGTGAGTALAMLLKPTDFLPNLGGRHVHHIGQISPQLLFGISGHGQELLEPHPGVFRLWTQQHFRPFLHVLQHCL